MTDPKSDPTRARKPLAVAEAFTAADHGYMTRALRLAARGLNACAPNPRVGCVLVRDGRVVGEGWHERCGEAHAEVRALAEAGTLADGAHAYVTLEPCAHTGKTPPCSKALLDAGVTAVTFAMRDPYPLVAGRGASELKTSGVAVREGLLAERAAALNKGFLTRMSSGRPRIRAKLAVSLDGRTAMANGESQWVTGEAARRDVHRLRAASSAVLTGVATVLADDPSLNVRAEPHGGSWRQPLRVVLDSRLRMPVNARMLSLPGETLVICCPDHDPQRRAALEATGATVVSVDARDGRVDPASALQYLGSAGVNDVLVEAGPTLQGALLANALVDDIVVYMAPHLMGASGLGMFELPGLTAMSKRIELKITDTRVVGKDLRLSFEPRVAR